jgi:hypothetical protein
MSIVNLETKLDQNVDSLTEVTDLILHKCKDFIENTKSSKMTMDQCLEGLKYSIELKKLSVLQLSLVEVIHGKNQK